MENAAPQISPHMLLNMINTQIGTGRIVAKQKKHTYIIISPIVSKIICLILKYEIENFPKKFPSHKKIIANSKAMSLLNVPVIFLVALFPKNVNYA